MSKQMSDFNLIEMQNSWNCSYCKDKQSYEQMAMKEIWWKDKICPGCYLDL